MTFLSLIIPCYNEAKNLPLLIDRCNEALEKESENIEVILVDNGSKDESPEVLSKLLNNHKFIRSVRVEENQGYGYGILFGLKHAKGKLLAWTHADMQTDPSDVLPVFQYFSKENISNIFLKGKRKERPIFDAFFTFGMSVFETILFGKLVYDINAQPNIFPRNFYEKWENPPYDFSLDLYVYLMAHKFGYKVKRFPVFFNKRAFGTSHWNVSFSAKIKFIKRTINYSLSLKSKGI